MRHGDEDPALRVDNGSEVRLGAVVPTFRGRRAARTPPEADVGDLRDFPDVEERLEERVIERQVDDGVLRRRQHPADLGGPVFPRPRAPEVVNPEEPAFQQVVPQPRDLLRPQAHRPDVGRDHKGTTEQLVIGDIDHPVVRLAFLVEVDVGGGQLREPDHEIDVGEGIVGRPPSPGRLAPDARVRQATEGKPIVAMVGRPEPGG